MRRDWGRAVEGTWPTAAALLLHGESPQSHIPAATIEMVRYAGADVAAAVVWRKTLTGSVAEQLEAAWTAIQAHLSEVPRVADGIRADFRPLYPLEALKELARNLVQHRQYEGTNAPGRIEWYDDRVEFSNPGAPFGRASEGELGDHSDYRNPALTRGLVELGFVEKLGRGLRLVRLALSREGHPPLEVETDGFTRVVIRRRT